MTTQSFPAFQPWVVGVAGHPDACRADSHQLAASCDVVEFRLDLWPDPSVAVVQELSAKVRAAGLKVLLTIRHASEGGRWTRPESERCSTYLNLLACADMLDVEIASKLAPSLRADCTAKHVAMVLSFHDFSGTPGDAELLFRSEDGFAQGADLVKLAVTIHDDAELGRVKAWVRAHAARPLSVIGMGARGAESRVLFPQIGSRLTYGFLDAATAPGQPSARDLKLALAKP